MARSVAGLAHIDAGPAREWRDPSRQIRVPSTKTRRRNAANTRCVIAPGNALGEGVLWSVREQAVYWVDILGRELHRWDPATGKVAVDPKQYQRLSPFDPQVRKVIGEIYEDLARTSAIHGVLFHDDAVLSDFEDASPQALKTYAANGLPGSIQALRADPEVMQRWTRFKSRYLIDFTHELTAKVRALRGPEVLTARNIYAEPMLNPASEAWFAQNLDDFLKHYDWTAPMAMPLMEGQSLKNSNAWLEKLVATVKARP
eukprot:gene6669-8482_t